MDRGIEPRTGATLVHGRMIYRCGCCGESWPMYLEKGIEEFGENHKPSPFMIECPYCGGWAQDVSGIRKVPGGGYVPLPDGYHYFANREDHPCGVPTFTARSAGNLVTEDVSNIITGMGRQLEDRVARRVENAIERLVNQMMAELAEKRIREAARILAEKSSLSTDKLMEALLNGSEENDEPKRIRGRFSSFTTAWDRKEERETQWAADRATASRFRQYKTRESAWGAWKRTGKRQKEWRGPWRE